MKFVDIFGWMGAISVVGAFGLITTEVVSAESLVYIALNIFGAIGVGYSSLKKKDFQPVAINAVWLGIALIGLFKTVL